MNFGKVYGSLDIGQSYLKLVVGTVHNSKLYICAKYNAPTRGLIGGEIINRLEFQSSIIELVNKAINDGYDLSQLIITLPANKLNIYRKKGDTQVLNNPPLITKEELLKIERAFAKHQILDYEMVVGIYPISYTYNGITTKEQPIGARLDNRNRIIEMDALVHALPIGTSKGYIEAIEDKNIEILDAYIAPIANMPFLRNEENKDGVLLLDIGHVGSNLSLIFNNLICAHKNINIGVDYIIKEIAKGCAVDYKTAEMLLIKYGSSFASKASGIVVYKDNEVELIEKDIVQIVENSLNQLINELKTNINLMIKDKLDCSLIIVGGGANIYDISSKLNKALNMNVERRTFQSVGGNDSSYNSSIGALLTYLKNKQLIFSNYR